MPDSVLPSKAIDPLTASRDEVFAWVAETFPSGEALRSDRYDPKLIEEVERVFGHGIASPEFLVKAFGGVDIDNGNFPGLPHTIIDFLNAPCELQGDFYPPASFVKNHDAYILGYLPGYVNGEPWTFSQMLDVIPASAKRLGLSDAESPQLWSSNDYGNDTIKITRPDTISKEGRWVLMPKYGLPGMESKTDEAQRAYFNGTLFYKDNFSPIEALEATQGYLGHYLVTGKRVPSDWWGRTDTRPNSGSCVLVGDFNPGGLEAGRYDGGSGDGRLGRLALRNF